MSRGSNQLGRLIAGAVVCLVGVGGQAVAHTIDFIEFPGEGGIQILSDGNVLNTFPGAESAIAGVNSNDGNYVPQLINVNLYENAAHTILSDTITITVPAANPPQITVGFDSDSETGPPLTKLLPEDIGLTETGGLQTLATLTNSNGIQTTIRVQSDAPEPPPPPVVPEPSSLFLVAPVLLGFLAFRRRRIGDLA